MNCVVPNAVWSHSERCYLCERCGSVLGHTYDDVRECDCDEEPHGQAEEENSGV